MVICWNETTSKHSTRSVLPTSFFLSFLLLCCCWHVPWPRWTILSEQLFFLFFSFFIFKYNYTDIKTYDVMIHALSKVNYSPAGASDYQPSPADAFDHWNSPPPPYNALDRAKVTIVSLSLFWQSKTRLSITNPKILYSYLVHEILSLSLLFLLESHATPHRNYLMRSPIWMQFVSYRLTNIYMQLWFGCL